MFTPYTSEDSSSFYDQYYSAQAGSGLTFFEGKRVMEGNETFSGLLKNLWKRALTRVVKGGVGVARDALLGGDVKASAMREFKRAGGGTLQDVSNALTLAPGRKKRKRGQQRGRGAETVFDT